MAAHARRSLQEASAAYERALRAAPPRDPSPDEVGLILKLAPALFTVPGEPFPLIDAAAILHPDQPWIAYHLFWEDDLDFPDDNDPCDHEVLWVRYDPQRQAAVEHFSYFHGRILRGDGPARIGVQWGKHGSLPLGASGQADAENRKTWERLRTAGRQSAESPLSRGWPLKFNGSWQEFMNFSKPVDLAAALRKKGYWKVSCLNNAVINRHFLRYNFAAKTEWPDAMCGR